MPIPTRKRYFPAKKVSSGYKNGDSQFHCFHYNTDIQTEKTHQSIFKGVAGFDKSSMRHAETQEKVVLPAKEGESSVLKWGSFRHLKSLL